MKTLWLMANIKLLCYWIFSKLCAFAAKQMTESRPTTFIYGPDMLSETWTRWVDATLENSTFKQNKLNKLLPYMQTINFIKCMQTLRAIMTKPRWWHFLKAWLALKVIIARLGLAVTVQAKNNKCESTLRVHKVNFAWLTLAHKITCLFILIM